MEPLFALQFITFTINTLLGFFVLLKNLKKETNQAFALFALGIAGWNLSIFLALSNFEPILVWGRLAFSFGSVMVAGLLWFVHVFPSNSKRSGLVKFFSIISGLIFFCLAASPLMIKSVSVTDGYITGEFFPPLYLLWTANFLLLLFYSLGRSWRSVYRLTGLARSQQLAVTLGISGFLLPFLLTNLLLPIFANDFRWNNLGPIFTLFLIGFTAHAIISYRFLEIRWVIKKSFDFIFLWFVSFVVIFSFDYFLRNSTNFIVPSLVSSFFMATLFVPVAQYVSKLTAKATARGSYVYEDAITDVSDTLNNSIGLDTLMENLAEKLQEYFGFTRVGLLAFSSENPSMPLKTINRGFSRDIYKALTQGIYFCETKNRQILEASELKWRLGNDIKSDDPQCDKQIIKFMQENKVEVMMPFFADGEMVGLGFFGEKKDKSILSKRDVMLLDVIRDTAAPSIMGGVRYEEIRRLYKQLSSVDKVKSDFIEVVSHQFRTPLTAILWNSEIALEGKRIPADTRDNLQEIRQRSLYLSSTLNNILDLLAMENNQLSMEKKLVDLRKIAEGVIKEIDPISKKRGVKVTTKLDPALVNGDTDKLTRVLRTLIENACQYTKDDGKVDIVIRTDKDTREVTITVKDNGAGIGEKDLPHVFDRFFRSQDAIKTTAVGTGVSLYLAKHFIEKHKGRISVNSRVGKGSEFTVALPLAEI